MTSECKESRCLENEWPNDGLERIDKCPICGSQDRHLLHEGLRDRVFFCAPGEWTLFSCKNCNSAYLDPRPSKESIGLAYRRYFTHVQNGINEMSLLSRMRRALANGYRNKKYGTVECPACKLGYWMMMLLTSQRAVLDATMRHLPAKSINGKLLDIGCGSGDFLSRASGAGWQVLGIDPDPVAVEVARSRGLDVRCGGIEILDDVDRQFEGITLSHVLEHVHDPVKLLESCMKLLVPGGWIWIDVPNITHPVQQADCGLSKNSSLRML
jgi:2-polyprenyl-3-methyl-5-hydroxy-6-metoxy-1,4-benzoquinol methylase